MEKPNLCIYVGYTEDVNSITNKYGSEITTVKLAEKFTDRYEVYYFGDCISKNYINSVNYINSNDYREFQKSNQIDILIIARYINYYVLFESTALKTFIWVHDCELLSWFEGKSLPENGKYLLKNNIDKIDGIITLCNWHKNRFINFYDIDPNKVFVIGSALEPNMFKNNIEKKKNKFIWTSSPIRGLNKIVEYFHEIKKKIPDAELYIYRDKSGISDELMENINNSDYIHFVGRVDNQKIIEEFQSAEIWFYPTNFPETYCLSSVEAQMAKCVCVATNLAALSESIEDRGVLLNEPIYSEEYKKKAIDEIVDILTNEERKKDYQERGYQWAKNQNWDERAKIWYSLFDNTYKNNNNKMNFSIAVISKNEENSLPYMLASLEKYKRKGGKVFLIDTGSSDSTVQIAKNWGCVVYEVGEKFIRILDDETTKIINEKFNDDNKNIVESGTKIFDYASARNFAHDMTDTDMVISIDCDEVIVNMDIDRLTQLINEGHNWFRYKYAAEHDKTGKETLKYDHIKFYNKKMIKWENLLHEIVESKIPNLTDYMLDENIFKIAHYQGQNKNRDHNLPGLALNLLEREKLGKSTQRAIFYLARELMYNGYNKTSIRLFKKHIENMEWNEDNAQSMLYLGDLTGDIEWYHKAFGMTISRRTPLIKLSEHYFNKKDYKRAICYSKASLEIKYTGIYMDNPKDYEDYVHWMLYYSYWYIGDIENSKIHYDIAISFYNIDELPNNYLFDYRWYYDLPIISILGQVDINSITYPIDKIEIINNLENIKGEYVITRDDIINGHSLMINYLKKIRNENTSLLTKEEFYLKNRI